MPIAYDGQVYDDHAAFEAATNPDIPDEIKKTFLSTPSTIPPQASTEPAGAFKSSGSTGTPVRSLLSKLTGMDGGERYKLWPERMLIDLQNTAHDVGAGKIPMWSMDPKTGDFHTSIEGLEAAHSLMPAAMSGQIPLRVQLREAPLPSTRISLAEEARLGRVGPVEDWRTTRPQLHEMDRSPRLQGENDVDYAIRLIGEALDNSHSFRQIPLSESEFGTASIPKKMFAQIKAKIDAAKNSEDISLIRNKTEGIQTNSLGIDRPIAWHHFFFANKKGTGELRITESNDGKNLYVNWIGSGTHGYANVNEFGSANIRQLLNQVKDEFPKAETISGMRISGARGNKGGGRASMRLRGKEPTYNKPDDPWSDTYE